MKRNKNFFQCEDCGYESLQWLGRCPSCGSWNTFIKKEVSTGIRKESKCRPDSKAKTIGTFQYDKKWKRYLSGMNEFDRVLGGGIVPGSLVLIGGEPGVGKSTLLLQVSNKLSINNGKTLYITAEESMNQVYLRAKRLEVHSQDLYIYSEADLDRIDEQIQTLKPKIAVIDSIQIIYDRSVNSMPGSVNQVKNCTGRLMDIAKKNNIAIIIIGHVTKGGAIAGPKLLEHMVDSVLYLEGEKFQAFKLLRGIKNRFGATHELGIFQMKSDGLQEVLNPSEMMLSTRKKAIAGTATTVTFEGSRPLVVEIEALVSTSFLTNPRRMTSGVDYNRVLLIIAVLENRLGMKFQYKDIYVNVAGGIRISEPAIDLGIALAIVSSFKRIALELNLVAFGEIGLTGELRSVNVTERRLKEAQKIGFTQGIIPLSDAKKMAVRFNNMKLYGISIIYDIVQFFKKKKKKE